MNLYFLLEGRRTEPKVYPAWLRTLLPQFTQVETASEAVTNNFYVISGQGFPRLLDVTLPNAVEEINDCGNFDHLVIVVDSDDATVSERTIEVQEYICEHADELGDCQVKIVVQQCCIESWFLGNRTVFTRTPQDATLRQYIEHFSVHENDPALMEKVELFRASKAEFHYKYLKLMLGERNVTYSKKSPGEVKETYYLQALIERVNLFDAHLLTFQDFLQFCRSIQPSAPVDAA